MNKAFFIIALAVALIILRPFKNLNGANKFIQPGYKLVYSQVKRPCDRKH